MAQLGTGAIAHHQGRQPESHGVVGHIGKTLRPSREGSVFPSKDEVWRHLSDGH